MHWPLIRKPIATSQIPFYNLHYLYACRPPADPTMMWGTDVPADELAEYVRERNRDSKILISQAHVLVQAVGRALKQHPELNRRIVGRRIHDFRDVNVRLMGYSREQNEVDILLVRHVDVLSLDRIARILWKNQHQVALGDTTDHADKAFLRKYLPGRMLGWMSRLFLYFDSRFNLPKTDRIDRTGCSPVVVNYLAFSGAPPMRVYKPSKYPHESSTLSVTMGRVERIPVVRNGQLEVGKVAPLFVRADHRIVSAYQLAQFTSTVRDLLIRPAQMESTNVAEAA